MVGYVRQSAASIVPTAEITATPLNNEFNAIQSAFNGTTGHTHDGSLGNGPKISLTDAVSGVLPVANGGLGQNTLAAFRTDLYSTYLQMGIDGTQALPAITWSADPDTGIYRSAANAMSFTTGGVNRMIVGGTAIVSNLPITNVAGSATAPAYTFNGDTDTGIYTPSANQVAITAGGVQQALFTDTINTLIGATSVTGALTIGSNINMDGPALISSVANFLIRPNTATGADDKQVSVIGGGNYSTSRGAIIAVHGVNHATYPGVVRILSGAGGSIEASGNMNVTGTITAPTFSGNLAATFLTGTIPSARISGAYTGFTNITGSGTVDFAKFLGNAADSAAAPSYTWTGDTDTGIWSASANQIGFATGGVNRMTLDDLYLTLPRIRLTAITDASTTSTAHAFQIGVDTGENLLIDTNEILVRNNGVLKPLYIEGGVSFGPGAALAVADGGTGATTAAAALTNLGAAASATQVIAGNGLSGGGTLAANRTITLGTPGTLNNSTTNAVTTTSHTHSVDFAGGIASMAHGSIGTYAMLGQTEGAVMAVVAQGGTLPGADLAYCGFSGTRGNNSNYEVTHSAGTSPGGTWKCMGRFRGTASDMGSGTLWLRIA